MMNKLTSKSLMSRLYLMSFILFSIIFTSENAFSKSWEETTRVVSCSKKDESITLKVYSWNSNSNGVYNYLSNLKVSYFANDLDFTPLIGIEMEFQMPSDEYIWAKVNFLKKSEIITYPDGTLHYKKPFQWVGMKVWSPSSRDKTGPVKDKYALFLVKWNFPSSIFSLKSIKITGNWCEIVQGKLKTKSFDQILPVHYVRSSSKAPQESNNNFKVTGKADVISVTGVNSGENIKVYNAVTNVEVRSVIAQDNVVNVRLPKGKVYLIKVGSKSTKVAL